MQTEGNLIKAVNYILSSNELILRHSVGNWVVCFSGLKERTSIRNLSIALQNTKN
jgi:hypothetical protein